MCLIRIESEWLAVKPRGGAEWFNCQPRHEGDYSNESKTLGYVPQKSSTYIRAKPSALSQNQSQFASTHACADASA